MGALKTDMSTLYTDLHRSLGICLGASTISTVQRVSGEMRSTRTNHGGKVSEVVKELIHNAIPARVGITGRKFRDLINIETVSEPEAVELAYDHIRPQYAGMDSILSAGSESFLVYALDNRGRIRSVSTGNKCASGTGEFFLQQIKRMDLDADDAVKIAASFEPHEIASRCSVFSKSDCTHALNKGVEKGRVAAGLCMMMAGKMIELLRAVNAKRVMVVGGVSQNQVVMRFLRKVFPGIIIPGEAPYFEALGAMLWAEQNGCLTEKREDLVKTSFNSFPILPKLQSGTSKVQFKSAPRSRFHSGDYIVGLDVGSTTTKAVLIRTDNQAIVASEYLRTLGDPVSAGRNCYRTLLDRIPDGIHPNIVGLGITGSGRQIAGLHALTEETINEIMAHAAAAVHFDPEVDTIFEIGGQDAKYTFITNGVPTDYAMNEACSAGTGSFLEEACMESFGVETSHIAQAALASRAPPNFSDQCAAFIGSDIKTAVQEGASREDSIAGLVYSVCQNYLNRVKGNRLVGKKVFMQGGVCYNRAVPLAMATLCDREIIVPPEPGLMGAFGAAIEVQRKISSGLIKKRFIDLAELASREINPAEPFICNGGREMCDRRCRIDRYLINERTYPFGGACNRYYNSSTRENADREGFDMVRTREDRIYQNPPICSGNGRSRTVGILSSLYTNTAYPLYAHFFSKLGLKVVRSDNPDPEGFLAVGSNFCFPVLQSHGFLKDMLNKNPDRIFIPHVKNAYLKTSDAANCTCPLIQGEPYYLKAAFHDELDPRLLTEVLDFNSKKQLGRAFIRIGRKLGFARRKSLEAFDEAWGIFESMHEQMKASGRDFLSSLPQENSAVVLFGRSYNAFTKVGNMGVPNKFTTRGCRIIPFDFLPIADNGGSTIDSMYWAAGQGILQAAEFIREKPNLFGVFITNFSCGPDSFIIERFRSIMGHKPFLTLEFDAHTADAGIDTRIEAFLDVVKGYRGLNLSQAKEKDFLPAQTSINSGIFHVRTSDGRLLDIRDPDVHMLLPSMGDTSTKAIAAAMRYIGIRATALRPPGQVEMSLGKGDTSCKECLPFILSTGSLHRYLNERTSPDEISVYFLPGTNGPCRFGQYNVSLREFIRKNRFQNVAVLSLSSENGYAGMPPGFTTRAIFGLHIGDGLDDIHAGILALAEDKEGALQAFEAARERILGSLASDSRSEVMSILDEEMETLAAIRKTKTLEEVTKITLTGEVYVRKDGFSSQYLVQKLARKEILVKTSPVYEWIQYINYIVASGTGFRVTPLDRLKAKIKCYLMERSEITVQKRLARSGFYAGHRINMDYLLKKGSSLISTEFTGEAILTVSSTLKEIGDETHGVISIGPFGCMPCRVAESILNHRLRDEKHNFSRRNGAFWRENKDRLSLPFLAIETDGNTFPQLIEARLENLILSANRLKEELKELKF